MDQGLSTNSFYLPWEQDKACPTINSSTAEELELFKSRCSAPSVFDSLLKPKTKASTLCLSKMATSFSNLPEVIKSQRQIVKSVVKAPLLNKTQHKALDSLFTSFEAIKSSKNFRSNYGFIDFEKVSFLNEIPIVMTLLVMYNVGSPLFSLFSPIVGALLAYIVLLIRGARVTITTFVQVLSTRFQWLFNIKKLFSTELSFFTRVKIVLSAGLYCFSIYQNIKSCRRFITNYKAVSDIFNATKVVTECITTNLQRLASTQNLCTQLSEYINHAGTMTAPARQIIEHIQSSLPLKFSNPTSVPLALRLFYKFKHCPNLQTSINWLLGLGGLFDVYDGLARGLGSGMLGPYLPTSSFENAFVRGVYHPTIDSPDCVRNDLSLKKSIVLTGQNGSGKTTLAKALAVAAIIGSQFGVAPCKKAQLPVLDTIRCELNIPDTNERDSLFEAEGRRCLELINDIGERPPQANHLCIFDELFSGTNADEALKAATGVLKHLAENYSTRFLVTTHMHKLGASLGNDYASSMTMEIDEDKPTHRVLRGVTETSGAHKTLMRIGFTDSQLNGEKVSTHKSLGRSIN